MPSAARKPSPSGDGGCQLYRMQKSLVALRFEGTKFAAKPKTLLEVFSGENAT